MAMVTLTDTGAAAGKASAASAFGLLAARLDAALRELTDESLARSVLLYGDTDSSLLTDGRRELQLTSAYLAPTARRRHLPDK